MKIKFIILFVISAISLFFTRGCNSDKNSLETGNADTEITESTTDKQSGLPSYPFKQLKNSDIEKAFVCILPDDVTAELDNNEISELISLLNESKTYLKDDSYGENNGQIITYTIIKKDKTKIEIKPFNPFLIIDGNGYITDSNNCEKLQQLGNSIAGIKCTEVNKKPEK